MVLFAVSNTAILLHKFRQRCRYGKLVWVRILPFRLQSVQSFHSKLEVILTTPNHQTKVIRREVESKSVKGLLTSGSVGSSGRATPSTFSFAGCFLSPAAAGLPATFSSFSLTFWLALARRFCSLQKNNYQNKTANEPKQYYR
ncbi:hypothetical protein RvY_07143 [Ramazzottius varieornatus]|uniref:Uncharacterized protein n=1 Tax=Ramazzottius varieornatus TaxID=947166 RepID=A0A1D1V665_RAMVA|nr:hypothetical protein RvY_07143 [Ramazzottius varieornatus]